MGLFTGQTGFSEAKIGGKGAYFTDGFYRVEIAAVKGVTSRKGQNYYTVEVKVLFSKDRTPGISAQPVGTVRSWMVGQHQDNFNSDVKSFLAAVYGYDPMDTNNQKTIDQNVTPEFAESTYATQPSPLKGRQLDLEAYTRKNKNNPGEFTVHDWKPLGMIKF